MGRIMDNVNAWLQSFPYREAVTRVKTLLVKKQEIDTELMRLQQYINLYEMEHPTLRTGKAEPEPSSAPETEAVPTLRQALLRVMDGSTPRRLSDVRETLVKRGWLSESDKDYHRLQMM